VTPRRLELLLPP